MVVGAGGRTLIAVIQVRPAGGVGERHRPRNVVRNRKLTGGGRKEEATSNLRKTAAMLCY